MDPHPRRTAIVTRLAMALYDGLATAGGDHRLRGGQLRNLLHGAAQLHAIDVDRRRTSRHKAASRFLRGAGAPPGWPPSDWDLLTAVVRYHRGAEPSAQHERFAQLAPDQRESARGLAGVLRLARGLRRGGVTRPGAVRIHETAGYVRVRISSLQNPDADGARLAAARHLLESVLRRPMVVECTDPAVSSHAPPRIQHRSTRLSVAGQLELRPR